MTIVDGFHKFAFNLFLFYFMQKLKQKLLKKFRLTIEEKYIYIPTFLSSIPVFVRFLILFKLFF
jgi:hypothetical protein